MTKTTCIKLYHLACHWIHQAVNRSCGKPYPSMARIARHLMGAGMGVMLVTGCSLPPKAVGYHSGYEFSSFEREKSKGAGSLYEAFAMNSTPSDPLTPPALYKPSSECRTEPVFQRYHLKAIYDKLAEDLQSTGVNVAQRNEFIVLKVPTSVQVASAQKKINTYSAADKEAFLNRLTVLVESVRDDEHINVFLGRVARNSGYLNWGDSDLVSEKLMAHMIFKGLPADRIQFAENAFSTGSKSLSTRFEVLEVKLCYR